MTHIKMKSRVVMDALTSRKILESSLAQVTADYRLKQVSVPRSGRRNVRMFILQVHTLISLFPQGRHPHFHFPEKQTS